MKITYEEAAKDITLEQVIRCYENGISVAVNDGRDVIITIEKGEE